MKNIKNINPIQKTGVTLVLLFFLFISLSSLNAQDYSEQVDAWRQSFHEKKVSPLQPYLSSELKFSTIPAANSPAILNNIVTNLPKLNSISILRTGKGRVQVKYDFEGLGVRESFIYFDANGKITRIELVENLIKQEMAAQKRLQESVQQPTLSELAIKFPFDKIEFKSRDGLLVSGNLYEIGAEKPTILLCHQARYNKFEYADIAPRLNELGYNCLAIDQRSGGEFASHSNETFNRALQEGKPTNFMDAQQDIEAAIEYLYSKYNRRIIIWGSSYSSSLVLFEAAKNEKVKASISFSPGDYFGDEVDSLTGIFQNSNKPYFITSSKEEATTLGTLIDNATLKQNQVHFIPKSDGFHGSRALWVGQKGADEYWSAILSFLNNINK